MATSPPSPCSPPSAAAAFSAIVVSANQKSRSGPGPDARKARPIGASKLTVTTLEVELEMIRTADRHVRGYGTRRRVSGSAYGLRWGRNVSQNSQRQERDGGSGRDGKETTYAIATDQSSGQLLRKSVLMARRRGHRLWRRERKGQRRSERGKAMGGMVL